MTKAEIVEILEEIAVLLELKGENPFKIRAYSNGARALETLEEDLDTLIESGQLKETKGIGDALVQKIETLHETGTLEFYSKLKDSVPQGLLDMLEIPGLGGKKIKKLHDALNLESVEELKAAAEDGRVADLKGFGRKTAENILRGIQNREAYAARHLWWNAREIADTVVAALRELEAVERVEAAGSLRRHKETVGDLDIIVASARPKVVMDWFTSQEHVREVTAKGETKSSVRFEGGLQADLRVVPRDQFAFALHHFTGSKEHNVLMRQRALERGYSLSEWGLNPKNENGDPSPDIQDEPALFRALGLAFIPPELREGRDELEAAENNAIPELLSIEDIRGVFHNHTTASDGKASLEDMVKAAAALGLEYLGIADHSKASFQANGLDEERVLKQIKQIRELNASGDHTCFVLAGCEVDIHADGRLDFEDNLLQQLDYVVASIHSSFSLSEAEQTRRLIRAIEHPEVDMVGHLTGRILLRREPYAIDVGKVIDACAANHTLIELNANPHRLDMDWRHWKRAAEKGVLCAINPDAHSTEGLELFKAGVHIARKGWLTREQVLNTRTSEEIQRYFGLD